MQSAGFEHVCMATSVTEYQRLLFNHIAVFAVRSGYAQYVAQINKVALCSLLLVQVKRQATGAPFGNEVPWGHCVSNPAAACPAHLQCLALRF